MAQNGIFNHHRSNVKRIEKRKHLIDVAAQIFNRMGYHAAGVDLIIAEAGIAKTTLYRHFDSKEDLIVAVLQRIDEAFRKDMRQSVNLRARDPIEKLLATFDFLEEWFASLGFRGCPFVNAAREFGDRTSPVFQAVAMHKRLMLAYYEELAHAAAFAEPECVAQEINLLHEGATATAHIGGTPCSAKTARNMAERTLHRFAVKLHGRSMAQPKTSA